MGFISEYDALIETKMCFRCRATLPVASFSKSARNATGLHSYCKTCMAEYERLRYRAGDRTRKERNHRNLRERAREHVWEYLAKHPCVDCGESNPVVLDFDHRSRSDKVRELSTMYFHSIGAIQAEIDKCDIRCANCHRIRTAAQLGTWRSRRDIRV